MAKDDLDAAWEGNLSVMDINYYKQYEPLFGSWRITRQIGEGSFGKVFEIERKDFGVTYRAALKAITVPASESELLEVKADGMDDASVRTYFGSFVEELVKEFALMSRLKGNSNIVSYEDHQVIEHPDDIGWDILIRMELLTPLNRYTSTHTVTRQDVIKLGIDLCHALELCQKFNIIHRDIKPENIFVSDMGDFKLGDFGIARTVEKTTSGLSKKGTYTYMAPEVYKGEAYGSTVDIYSLGIVLYRLLNGNRTPFLPAAPAPITHADRENALARRFSGASLPAPSHAEGRLAEIVLKACAYDPRERYSSPMQMRQELESILYSREEGQYIYPEGDDVPQDSVHYVKTGEEPPVAETEATQRDSEAAQRNSGADAADMEDEGGTVSDFGGTVSDFGREREDSDRTVSDFGGAANENADMAGDVEDNSGNFTEEKTAVKTVEYGRRRKQKKSAKFGAAILVPCLLVVCIIGISLIKGRTDASVIKDEEGRIVQEALSETTYAVYEYDENGERIKKNIYETNGTLIESSQYEYIYEANGNLNSIEEYNESGALIRKYLYPDDEVSGVEEYDENGNLSKDSTYVDGKLSQYRLIEYSENGQVARESYYNADDVLSTDLKYDENGGCTEAWHYNEDGTLKEYYLSENDENGDMLKSSCYNADHVLVKVSEYGENETLRRVENYNTDGTLIEVESYSTDGTLIKVDEYN